MIFTVDWESWFCYRPYSQFWEETDPLVEEPTMYLLDLLRRHQIKAIWYCLGWLVNRKPQLFLQIKAEGHVIGDHTYFHEYNFPKEMLENHLFRAPRFVGQTKLYSGGFWFRALPYKIFLPILKQSGIMFIHPHDVLLEHPKTGSVIQDFKRQTGLKTVRDKLERLCREVTFENPVLQSASSRPVPVL